MAFVNLTVFLVFQSFSVAHFSLHQKAKIVFQNFCVASILWSPNSMLLVMAVPFSCAVVPTFYLFVWLPASGNPKPFFAAFPAQKLIVGGSQSCWLWCWRNHSRHETVNRASNLRLWCNWLTLGSIRAQQNPKR